MDSSCAEFLRTRIRFTKAPQSENILSGAFIKPVSCIAVRLAEAILAFLPYDFPSSSGSVPGFA